MARETARRALSDLKVVELGGFISAAYCAKLMADLGAEVIKVEPPGSGDEARRHGPFPGDKTDPERSGLFLYLNANKLGITLDVTLPAGHDLLLKLVRDADVVVENNPPSLMERLGIDYRHLSEINQNLIVTSITPFGQSGPYRDYKAYAINTAAAGGTSLTLGEWVREPLTLPLSLGHYESATIAATATLAAFLARPFVGHGQQIDISEAEVWATMHTGSFMHGYIMHNFKKMRSGHRRPDFFPNGVLRCKDGYVGLLTTKGSQWKSFLQLVGGGKIPEWYSSNPKYTGTFLRDLNLKYSNELEEELSEWLMQHTKEEIFALCREADVPVAPVRTMEEVVHNAHLREREFFATIDHPVAGTYEYPGPPCRFSRTPWQIERPAPTLGQHNRDIYGERLGYSEAAMAELSSSGVI